MSSDFIKNYLQTLYLSYDKTKNSLNGNILNQLENEINNNEHFFIVLAQILIKKLYHKNYDMRLSSIMIADYFFGKYPAFTLYYSTHIKNLLDKVIYIDNSSNNTERAKSEPSDSEARRILNNWVSKYQDKYVKLKTVANMLVHLDSQSLKLQEEKDSRLKMLFLEKCEKAQKHVQELRIQMNSCLKEMSQLMELLIPKIDIPSSSAESDISVKVCPYNKQNANNAHGYDINTEIKVFIPPEAYKITETSDNKSTLDKLKSLYLEVSNVTKILTRKLKRLRNATNKFEIEFVKEIGNFRNILQIEIKKCNELGIDKLSIFQSHPADVSDNSDFEDVDLDAPLLLSDSAPTAILNNPAMLSIINESLCPNKNFFCLQHKATGPHDLNGVLIHKDYCTLPPTTSKTEKQIQNSYLKTLKTTTGVDFKPTFGGKKKLSEECSSKTTVKDKSKNNVRSSLEFKRGSDYNGIHFFRETGTEHSR
uniref:CID domain-containing protein n=1 Tax=Rhabditophanes sp. KR3021 TaxID=114890 RepID=A0AC35UGY9_9BILA